MVSKPSMPKSAALPCMVAWSTTVRVMGDGLGGALVGAGVGQQVGVGLERGDLHAALVVEDDVEHLLVAAGGAVDGLAGDLDGAAPLAGEEAVVGVGGRGSDGTAVRGSGLAAAVGCSAAAGREGQDERRRTEELGDLHVLHISSFLRTARLLRACLDSAPQCRMY